jgi:hypothetical protein
VQCDPRRDLQEVEVGSHSRRLKGRRSTKSFFVDGLRRSGWMKLRPSELLEL